MERFKGLNGYQKSLMIFMIVMAIIFAIVYPKIISREGLDYKNTILVPREENGNTIYEGEINGKESRFIVSADKTVEFHHGDKIYGPYTAKIDPTAIPEENGMADSMTGVELREGEEILFRGGVLDLGESYLLFNENVIDDDINYTYVTNDGIVRDEHGNPVDTMQPSVHTILDLMDNPELTHRGAGGAWFGAVIICILNAVTILFADELFRFQLAFTVRYPDDAEPTDWVIATRYISWTVMAIIALVVFVIGLQ